jgi:PIN domain nuclease of toxin-antitoxin system
MRTLVDTHAILWWLGGDERLSEAASKAIGGAEEPLVSAGTLFEVAIKQSVGKLRLPGDWIDELLAQGFSLLPINPSHSKALSELSFVELDGSAIRDPFDRLLVAQSDVEGVPVVTRDPAIRAHGAATIW